MPELTLLGKVLFIGYLAEAVYQGIKQSKRAIARKVIKWL